jgi:serine/threonine-protein kinase
MDHPGSQIYEFDGFRLDVPNRLFMTGAGDQIPLKPKVFDTLVYLVNNRGRLIEKDELMSALWADTIVEENNLNKNISSLRSALGEKPGEQRFIVTVAGHGYRFVPEVRAAADDTGDDSRPVAEEEHVNEHKRGPWTLGWVAAIVIPVVLICVAAGYFWWRDKGKPAGAQIRSLAVLPFKPLVLENRNEALEFGLADSLISRLSGGDETVIRPIGSVRRYTSVDSDPMTAGRELGVESVLDGTIQMWGDRVRISAKLLRSSDGKQLWAGQFDEKFTDIFTVQDAIADKVASALKIRMGGKPNSTHNLEAYKLYMLGRYRINKLTPADIQASIPYFQQAIDLDPRYALAYTGLSKAYGVLAISGELPPDLAIPLAKAAGLKALEIDETLVEAQSSVCMATFWHDWDWQAAERECRRSLELNPNNADTHGYLATILSSTGRHGEALNEVKISLELNPLELSNYALEGQYLLHAGRVDEALEHLRKAAELEPNFFMPHMFAASAYIEKRMFDEAMGESRKEYELSGSNIFSYGTFALAKSGQRDEAQGELNELLKISETKYVPPYNIALIYNALEKRGDTIDWLERAYQQRDPKMTLLKVEPKWNNLRDEPRFVDIMRRMNFP